MSRKVFTADEILTAADVNSFLMDQTVMSFAGTAARGSAIITPTEGMVSYLEDIDSLSIYNGTQWVTNRPTMTFASSAARGSAVPSPVEGMTAYLQDTDALQTYSGSAWVGVGGATLLVNQTFNSGSSVQINNVFSSLYNDYLVIISNVRTSTASFCQIRLSVSGTPATANEYYITQAYWSSATITGVSQLETGFKLADSGNTDNTAGHSVFTLTNPNRTLPTSQHFNLFSNTNATIGGGVHRNSTAYDGVTILTGNTFTSGQVRIYGYRNA